MESYITITTLNDFVFCPKSIYFHKLYGRYNNRLYKQNPQIIGTIKHESIDEKKYSSLKRYIQALEVYSEKYNLCGKIDIYDQEKKELIERKNKIIKIYDGYRYQLYAQYFCLLEMGYEVQKLFFHSLSDNKRYEIDLPTQKEIREFEEIIEQIKSFDVTKSGFVQNPEKCKKCIYRELCDSNPF